LIGVQKLACIPLVLGMFVPFLTYRIERMLALTKKN
jgi:hypothetical protein